VVFAAQATASLSAGTLLFLTDWRVLAVTSLLPLLLVLTMLLALRRRIAPAPQAVGGLLIPATGPESTPAQTLPRTGQPGPD